MIVKALERATRAALQVWRELSLDARIVGAVPLLQTMKEGEQNTPAGFQIVSSILTSTAGAGAFTRKIVASGHAASSMASEV